jgi:hypothetical protein
LDAAEYWAGEKILRYREFYDETAALEAAGLSG